MSPWSDAALISAWLCGQLNSSIPVYDLSAGSVLIASTSLVPENHMAVQRRKASHNLSQTPGRLGCLQCEGYTGQPGMILVFSFKVQSFLSEEYTLGSSLKIAIRLHCCCAARHPAWPWACLCKGCCLQHLRAGLCIM